MKTKIYILIGIIVVTIFIAGFFMSQTNTPISTIKDVQLIQNSVPVQQTQESNPAEINCNNLKNEILGMLDKANNCNTDADCVFESRYYCPFGCGQFFNKKTDLVKIDQKVKSYNENKCQQCEYECTPPPEKNDIKCLNSRCIDKRYQN